MNYPQTKNRRPALSGLLARLVVRQVEWRGVDEEKLLVSLVGGPQTWEAIDCCSDEELSALAKRVRWIILVDGFNRKWTWRVITSQSGSFDRNDKGVTWGARFEFRAVMCDDRNEARIWPNPSGVGLTLGEGMEIVVGRRQAVVPSAEREGC
ncbi:MAG: hypothetical protein HY569_02760 [Candidatus Magasanikbacteria bacterium]|nr:hypothetical protein [Candidatus Magasanikbacteria bacterium]